MRSTPEPANLRVLGDRLCRSYGLGKLHEVAAMPSQGFSNLNVQLISDRGTYVMRGYRQTSLEKVTQEIRLLNWLVAQGYPAVAPLLDSGGEAIFMEEEQHGCPWVAFPFLEGEEPVLGVETSRAVGEASAWLHCLTPPEWADVDCKNALSVEATKVWARFAGENMPSIGPRFKDLVELLAPQVESTELPGGCVHGDLFPDNTLFSGNRLVAVLDFEEACEDVWIFDVAMAMHGFCYTGEGLELHLAQAFLDGYQSKRNLGGVEVEQLAVFLRWCPLAMAGWHIGRHSVAPNTRQAKRIAELIRRAERDYSITGDVRF